MKLMVVMRGDVLDDGMVRAMMYSWMLERGECYGTHMYSQTSTVSEGYYISVHHMYRLLRDKCELPTQYG